jgi:hypothetical protein
MTDNSVTDVIRYPQFIASATRNAGTRTVTVTTEAPHVFIAGQYISINSAVHFSFTGVFKILTVPSTTQFTYEQAGPTVSFSGGAPKSTATQVQQVTIPADDPTPPGYHSTPVSTFVAYTCIVTPVEVVAGAPKRWSGQFVITPRPTNDVAWSLGTSGSEYQLCRFTGNYKDDLQLSNSEHPLIYRGVTGALDNQNYVVIKGDKACPKDNVPDLLPKSGPPDYINSNTTRHQNISILAGARPYGGLPSGKNDGGRSQNGGIGADWEPTEASAELPMY